MHAWRRSMLLFAQRALCIAMTGTAPALAGEVQTECPLAHPEKPDVHLPGECHPTAARILVLASGSHRSWKQHPHRVDVTGGYKARSLNRPSSVQQGPNDRPYSGAGRRFDADQILPADLDNLKPGGNPDPQIRTSGHSKWTTSRNRQ